MFILTELCNEEASKDGEYISTTSLVQVTELNFREVLHRSILKYL